MDIRTDIRELMHKCIGCGKCRKVCPSLKHGGCDPMDVLMGGDRWQGCIGCGRCSEVCRYTDPKKVMMYNTAVRTPMPIPDCYKEEGYNLPSGEYPYGAPDYRDSDIALMPGCIVNASERFLENASVKALGTIGIDVRRFDEGCCVYPVPYRIMTDGERDKIKKEMLQGYDRIINLCNGCCRELVDSGADAEHIIHTLHRHIDQLPKGGLEGMKVVIQPGCSMVTIIDLYKDVCRRLGAEVMDVEPGCCGKGTKVRESIMTERQKSMEGADAVIVGCPACFMWYDKWEGGIPVMYIAEAVAICTGDRRSMECHRIPLMIGDSDEGTDSRSDRYRRKGGGGSPHGTLGLQTDTLLPPCGRGLRRS